MKNIFILPTDKPSKLCYDKNENLLFSRNEGFRIADGKQNIYITSDEKVKEVDIDTHTCIFVSSNGMIITLAGKGYGRVKTIGEYYKIILTTDPQLIADGVQAIDDEFLEWFVKNPTCEEVKVDLVSVNEFGSEITTTGYGFDKFNYKIIIPKKCCDSGIIDDFCINTLKCKHAVESSKQQSVEDLIESTAKTFSNVYKEEKEKQTAFVEFKHGAYFIAKRMYSEEDLHNAFYNGWIYRGEGYDFPQAKKEWSKNNKKEITNEN